MPSPMTTGDLHQDKHNRLHRPKGIKRESTSSAQQIKSSKIQRNLKQSREITVRQEIHHISPTIHQLMENYNQAGEEDKRLTSSFLRKCYPMTSHRSKIILRLPITNRLHMPSPSRALSHNSQRMEALLPSRLNLTVL